MKHLFSILFLVIAGLCFAGSAPVAPQGASVNVTQHHNNPSRDGLFIDPAFTPAAATSLTRDLGFSGTIVGNVYAQPLYIEDGPGGVAMVIAVTQSNNVYALNAATGAIVWQRNVGTPITSGLPCGNINPLGITGTPIVDLASRSLFLDAEVSGFGHRIFSLNVDTGDINAGWPVTLNTAVSGFDSSVQSERGALGIVGNTLYVPYGGRFGDCGSYRGRLVGVQLNNPAMVGSWATGTTRAGVWAPGGVASDGTNTYVTTGNGTGSTWNGNEAVIRLQPGPVFSGSTTDFWAPTNWMSLDSADADLSGSGPIIVDVPGATPSALVVAIGKDRNAYLLNRGNLGGVSAPLAQANVSTGTVIGAPATYRTSTGTFVVHRPISGTLLAFRITATNPPTIATGWSVASSGRTAPFVTSTDGTNNVIVWAAGSDGRLRGYSGETGATIFTGGGANELMTGIRSFNTGIAARGRIYYAADNRVYAFTVPTGNPTPTPTPPATPTPTPTPPATPTPTPTPPATPTPSVTPPTTPTPSATPPTTPTPSATPPTTPTPSATPPTTPTPSATPPTTPTPTATATPIATPTATATATIAPTATPSSSPTPAAQPLNLSTRMSVQTGDSAGIGGFIITGTVPKHVLIRAIGPSLAQFGVPNFLADPTLELNGPGSFVTVTNNNWREDATQEALIKATGIAPTNDLESAIDVRLVPGAYTAIVRGNGNTSGVGLVEVYDLGAAALARLANISTRAFVNTGDNVVIAGFILGGSSNDGRIVARGIGPSLTEAGVPNALANPKLELRDNDGTLLVANNDWQDDPAQAAELTAAGLALTDNLEAGIATALPPGVYTAILAGQNNGTGVGLVEVYDLGAQ